VVPQLRTERLLLREWRDADRERWAALNADPEVMRYLGAPLNREQADGWLERNMEYWDEHDHGLWAVDVVDDPDGPPGFIGFIGLLAPSFDAHFTPCVEVGWRLARSAWGRGYAPEGARAAIAYGFDVVALDEIVSMTTVDNQKSRRVMEKLGMTRDPADDFDHPRVPAGSPLVRHVLYRISAHQ
jgi:ribosomal-protein-alanine N-acetyltransferase